MSDFAHVQSIIKSQLLSFAVVLGTEQFIDVCETDPGITLQDLGLLLFLTVNCNPNNKYIVSLVFLKG